MILCRTDLVSTPVYLLQILSHYAIHEVDVHVTYVNMNTLHAYTVPCSLWTSPSCMLSLHYALCTSTCI